MTEKIKQNDFHQNQNFYAEVLADFRTKLAAVCSHGPAQAIEKHRSRGKLLDLKGEGENMYLGGELISV